MTSDFMIMHEVLSSSKEMQCARMRNQDIMIKSHINTVLTYQWSTRMSYYLQKETHHQPENCYRAHTNLGLCRAVIFHSLNYIINPVSNRYILHT